MQRMSAAGIAAVVKAAQEGRAGNFPCSNHGPCTKYQSTNVKGTERFPRSTAADEGTSKHHLLLAELGNLLEARTGSGTKQRPITAVRRAGVLRKPHP